ncbi:anti-sigma factor [Flavobacteriaceae bacterium R38]|nr:anti-sigma factor [Flavobacteriaceae bacterium R38]
MDQKYSDDSFLGRWINNDLTEEEIIAFKKSKEYKEYQKIILGADQFKMPKMDTSASYKKFISAGEQGTKQVKVKKLIPGWVYAAASIVIILGTIYFFGFNKTLTTGFGEQITMELPDGSKVRLNSKSSIHYNTLNWKKNRKVTLKGEAFFEVQKGSNFDVKSSLGTVRVLGTKFNVRNRNGLLEVKCYEGKVAVESGNEKTVLTKGKAFRSEQGLPEKTKYWDFNADQPDWLLGESSFISVPLKQVIHELEIQFNLKIDDASIDTEQRFTGSFGHADKEIAIETVFAPLEINYTFGKEGTVFLSK